MPQGIVAVHCGAGFHSSKKYAEYNRLSRKATMKGIQILNNGGSALEAVKESIIVLENNPETNCGFGSNLTMDGDVENDASIMDGKTLLYGGCGAVKSLKNPIELAYDLCKKQTLEQALGLIPPSLLVDTGALNYAKSIGLKIVNNKKLISSKSLKQYKKFVKMYKDYKEEEQNFLLDTVGAVCMDKNGDFAAACSSGGILLKRSGRVGQGALYASGTWADSFDKTEPSVAVCTSGCGEHLVQTQLAKEIAKDLKENDCPTTTLHKSISTNFINSRYLRNVDQKLCGVLVVHRKNSEISFVWGHTTETMSIGYMKTDDAKPKGFISELQKGSKVGQTINIGGSYYYLEPTDANS